MDLNLENKDTYDQNHENTQPPEEDLNIQYQLFCTRKADIEQSIYPNNFNEEVFYDCIEEEPEEFHDPEEFDNTPYTIKRKPFHLKINHTTLQKGDSHQFMQQEDVDT